jgi:catechol 2,3-dioxygenase-like lactoylglutathione lyase family enzyme
MKFNGMLNHVEINVSNLIDSRKFWSPFLIKLGYELYQEWGGGFSYMKEGTYIVFVQTHEQYLKLKYHRSGTGLNHLAFLVDNREEVDGFRDLIKNYGLNELYSDRYPHAGGNDNYALFFEDPDRIKIEVTCEV